MAFSRGPSIVTDGLVLALDAANHKSYPGSGTTWYDLSSGGNSGALTNGPTFDSDNGGSLVFDGVDDYIDINTTIALGNPCTVTAMVNIDSIGSYTIFGPGANGSDNGLGTNGTQLELFATETSDTNNFTLRGSGLICDGTRWHHVACTINGATAKVWIDGQEKNTVTKAFTIGGWSGIADIGRRGALSQRYLPGKIAAVMGYNRALSASEVLQNYNATKSRFGL